MRNKTRKWVGELIKDGWEFKVEHGFLALYHSKGGAASVFEIKLPVRPAIVIGDSGLSIAELCAELLNELGEEENS